MEASVADNDRLLEAVAEGEEWEAVLFEGACRGAQQAAKRLLEAIDQRLARQRPA